MKINIRHEAKITACLDQAQDGASARLLDVDDVAGLAQDAEEHLKRLGLPKCHRAGASATMYEADLPNAYKWAASTTAVVLERGPTGWLLADARRRGIWGGSKSVREVALSPEQVDYLAGQLRKPQGI